LAGQNVVGPGESNEDPYSEDQSLNLDLAGMANDHGHIHCFHPKSCWSGLNYQESLHFAELQHQVEAILNYPRAVVTEPHNDDILVTALQSHQEASHQNPPLQLETSYSQMMVKRGNP
jgi:hypothetical protein